MRGDTAHRLDVERACLRLRLAAAALATTLALVALPRADAFAAVVIPIALAAAVVLRYLDPGRAPTARIAAGLAWAPVRPVTERERIRRHATARRAITAGKDLTSVLGMLVTQLIALGLEVWVGDDPNALRRAMGTRRGFVEPLPMESARHIAVAVPEDALDGARLETVARDLVADAGPLITSADRILRGERLVGATGRSLEALLDMARD